MTLPSATMNTTVRPRDASSSARASGGTRFSSRSGPGPMTSTLVPSTRPSTPRPATALKLSAGRTCTPSSTARRPMATAIGCSDDASTAAAMPSTSASVLPPYARTSVAPNLPSVSVPVLSNMTERILLASSKACRSLTRKPELAAKDVETATTSGIARPRAWGQEMTMTVTARSTAKLAPLPMRAQAAKVRMPAETAMITRSMAARSARFCVRERLSCAFLTTSITWLRYVSSPVRRTSTTREPSPLTEPPMTSLPSPAAWGMDSPVSRDSST